MWATDLLSRHRIASALALALHATAATAAGPDITEADLTSDDCVIQLGYPPYRIDILTRISGVEFEDAWSRRS